MASWIIEGKGVKIIWRLDQPISRERLFTRRNSGLN